MVFKNVNLLNMQSSIFMEAPVKKKDKAYCIFLYFAKAFGTVNHAILLTMLEYYGVRGIAYELAKSYFQ